MFPQINSPNPSLSIEKFDEWNEEKKFLHSEEIGERYINPREIWYIKMGINIGNEQNGKGEFFRPVLVIRRIGNMYFCMPLTTQGKDGSPFYFPIIELFDDKKSWIIVSQGRVFDKRRFTDFVGKISPEEFFTIKKFLKNTYFGGI